MRPRRLGVFRSTGYITVLYYINIVAKTNLRTSLLVLTVVCHPWNLHVRYDSNLLYPPTPTSSNTTSKSQRSASSTILLVLRMQRVEPPSCYGWDARYPRRSIVFGRFFRGPKIVDLQFRTSLRGSGWTFCGPPLYAASCTHNMC